MIKGVKSLWHAHSLKIEIIISGIKGITIIKKKIYNNNKTKTKQKRSHIIRVNTLSLETECSVLRNMVDICEVIRQNESEVGSDMSLVLCH